MSSSRWHYNQKSWCWWLPESLNLLLRGPWTSAQDFIAIHLITDEIFPSGAKWCCNTSCCREAEEASCTSSLWRWDFRPAGKNLTLCKNVTLNCRGVQAVCCPLGTTSRLFPVCDPSSSPSCVSRQKFSLLAWKVTLCLPARRVPPPPWPRPWPWFPSSPSARLIRWLTRTRDKTLFKVFTAFDWIMK